MLRIPTVALLAVVASTLLSGVTVSAAPFAVVGSSLRVTGAVSAPHTYSLTDLGALPQVTVTSDRSRGGSVTGVALQTLVARSAPRLDTGKNPLLRVAVTVRGAGRAVTFALGELDPGFGNHPAILAADASGSLSMRTDLVVPGDRTSARSVFAVSEVDVSVDAPGSVSAPVGTTDVVDRGRTVRLSTAVLSRLPQRRQTVSFSANGVLTSRTFVGPDLAAALHSVGALPRAFTSVVTVTGIDGYAANVTLSEASVGKRPLLLALSENGTQLSRPRLVAIGDIKGGRYVSDTTSIVIRNH